MELRQLKYFLAVADARSFVAAANSLFISRQAVSKSIAQLEAELNVELFQRDSSGAALTPVGILFYERVRNCVLDLEQLQAEIGQYGAQFRQIVRVVFSIGTLSLCEQKIQQFIREQNNITIEYWECTPSECERLLREHKADLAITSVKLTDDLFESSLLLESPFGILLKGQEGLEDLDTIDSEDLRWLPLGCFDDGQSQALCNSLGVTPLYNCIDLIRLFSLSATGQSATLLPECLFPPEFHTFRWVPLEPTRNWQLYGVSLKSAESNTLVYSAMTEFLMQVFDWEPV